MLINVWHFLTIKSYRKAHHQGRLTLRHNKRRECFKSLTDLRQATPTADQKFQTTSRPVAMRQLCLHAPGVCNPHQPSLRGSAPGSGGLQAELPHPTLLSTLSSVAAVSTACYAAQWFCKPLQEHLRTKGLYFLSCHPHSSNTQHICSGIH